MLRIQDFIEELRTKSTQSTYRGGIYSFFDWKYGRQRAERNATHEERERYEKLAEEYLSTATAIPDDLRNFAVSMRKIPPKTAQARMNAIRQFLIMNDVEISEKDWRRIRSRLPLGGPSTEEKELTPDILRRILMHAGIRGRAFFLFLLATGMRVGEAVQVRLSDVDLTTTPPTVLLKDKFTKTRKARITFLTREAADALQEWLKVRKDYLHSAAKRNSGLVAKGIGNLKNKRDNRVFPFGRHVADNMWKNLLKKADIATRDETTQRHQYRIHQLRKMFRTHAAMRAPVDIVEALMGHSGYLTDAYRCYSKDQLAEAYKKIEPALTLAVPMSEHTVICEHVAQETENTKEIVSNLVIRNEQLQKELSEIKGILNVLSENPDVLKRILVSKSY